MNRLPSACALALLCACGPSLTLTTPSGFVELTEESPDETFDYRATTADGLVLAARQLEHSPHGTLEFWTRAVENEIRQRGGYALLESQPVKTAGGLSGTQLRFGHDEGRKPHLYYVTIFVTERFLYLLEAGGEQGQLEQHRAALDSAVASLRID